MHTTNYKNTFIEIAEDSLASSGTLPPNKDEKTVANLQFDMIKNAPYTLESDEVLFSIHALRKDLIPNDEERANFFSKGQACMRASPLTKRYGWGVHFDENAKMALYACDSKEYQHFVADPTLKKWKAMRSSKKIE